MVTLYYESKTQNVERFLAKINVLRPFWNIKDITKIDDTTQHGHLITFTASQGECPPLSLRFAFRNQKYLLSVSASGNRNFGQNFATSADIIAHRFDVPIAHKFELAGFDSDIDYFIDQVERIQLMHLHGLKCVNHQSRLIVISPAVDCSDKNNLVSFDEYTDITDLSARELYNFLGY